MLLQPSPAPLRAPQQIHFLLPTIAAAAVVAVGLLVTRLPRLQRLAKAGGNVATVVIPRAAALLTFVAGVILLFAGATPATVERIRVIRDLLPLPLVEISRWLESLAGIGLLILARGLQRRLDAAYVLTLIVGAAGVLSALAGALDYEAAVILTVMVLLLVPNRRYFYRRTSLFEERFSRGWVVAIALVVLGATALAYLAYGTETRFGLGQFAYEAQAPRFVRTLIVSISALMAFALLRLLRPARVQPPMPAPEDLDAAERVIGTQPEAAAHLAMLGDKALRFNGARTAFVMYRVSGRTWVMLGDPVGPIDAAAELIHEFVDDAHRHGAYPAFYKVGPTLLYLYLDYGLSVVKLGEEARVNLTTFSMEGAQRRNLRRVWRKIVDDGCRFEMLSPEQTAAELPALRAISDVWLAEKNASEKGFSLGWFAEDYVRRYPVGVVRKEGRIVAFANLWRSGLTEELEVDLMRFSSDAPPGVMRYLLVELMLWGKGQGWKWFNLGMSPLSGLRGSGVPTIWNQMGRLIFGRAERFYNFQGIREFKQWFYPEWEPRFLVSPGGAARGVVLANISALIAGSVTGIVRK